MRYPLMDECLVKSDLANQDKIKIHAAFRMHVLTYLQNKRELIN
jgi:hypothetical protein